MYFEIWQAWLGSIVAEPHVNFPSDWRIWNINLTFLLVENTWYLDSWMLTQIARFMGQHGAHLGPVGPRWAPWWPHEPSYQGKHQCDACMGASTSTRRAAATAPARFTCCHESRTSRLPDHRPYVPRCHHLGFLSPTFRAQNWNLVKVVSL